MKILNFVKLTMRLTYEYWRPHSRIKPAWIVMALNEGGYFVVSKPHELEKNPKVKGFIFLFDTVPVLT